MLIVDLLLLLLLFVFATGGRAEVSKSISAFRKRKRKETEIDTTDRWQWIEDQVSNNSIQADIGIICNSRNIVEESMLRNEDKYRFCRSVLVSRLLS